MVSLKSFSLRFWILNLMQMAERLAFWIVLLQLPVYIAQKDTVGGLQFGQESKGIIFFWWALVQNTTPIFAGAYSDKYGSKKTLLFSFILIVFAYLLLGSQREYLPFLMATILLGFGSGIFKPALHGALASTMTDKNSSVGWGMYVMLVNLAVFFGPPLAIWLKGISWEAVFIGSAAIFSLNFITILFFKENPIEAEIKQQSSLIVLKRTLLTIVNPKILPIILLMSGFTMVYMQFYETLPNFIVDWVDSSTIVNYLPPFMLRQSGRGTQIAYEWFYNINSAMIILFVVLISMLFSKKNKLLVLTIGIFSATAGLLISGVSDLGIFTVIGFVIYTFGEMVANPKFNEVISLSAPTREKGLYMSMINISWAFGLAGGSIMGGYLYKHFGEKAGFALRWLAENGYVTDNISLQNAFEMMCIKANLSSLQAEKILWNEYSPFIVWLPFVALGLISSVGMIWLKKRSKNNYL